jgi:hypothetical protein
VPISRDALNFFVVFLVSKLSKKDIQFIMSKKDSILDMITEDPKFFLEKTPKIGKRVYTFRGMDK